MAAARTPTLTEHSMGSNRLLIATITSCVTGDTWVSGIKNIVDYWAQASKTDGTQASAGVNVSLSGSTFTIVPGIDTQTVKLFVICKH